MQKKTSDGLVLTAAGILALHAAAAYAATGVFEAKVPLNGNSALFPGTQSRSIDLQVQIDPGNLPLQGSEASILSLPNTVLDLPPQAEQAGAAPLRSGVFAYTSQGSLGLTRHEDWLRPGEKPADEPGPDAAVDAPTQRRLGRNAVLGGPGGMTLTSRGPEEQVTAGSTEEFLAKKAGPLAYSVYRANQEAARIGNEVSFFDTALQGAKPTFGDYYPNHGRVQARGFTRKVDDPSAPALLRPDNGTKWNVEVPRSAVQAQYFKIGDVVTAQGRQGPVTGKVVRMEGDTVQIRELYDVDRNSVVPFSRALVRYGMDEKLVGEIVRGYLAEHAGAPQQGYHGLLLGIRAANLMAQWIAANEPTEEHNAPGESWGVAYSAERLTGDRAYKQALILAALLHRTGNPHARAAGTSPSASDAVSRLGYSEVGSQLSGVRIYQDNLRKWVESLIRVTDYGAFRSRTEREEAVARLTRDINPGGNGWAHVAGWPLGGIPGDEVAHAVRLGAALQFATRAAMFVDGPEFAEQAVRALAAEARAASRSDHPTDQEALLEAAGELRSLGSGRMPITGEDGHYMWFPLGSTAWSNLWATSSHFHDILLRGINSGRTPMSLTHKYTIGE